MYNAVAVVKEKLNANVNYKITLEPERTSLTIELFAETRDKTEKPRDKTEKPRDKTEKPRDKTEKQGIKPKNKG